MPERIKFYSVHDMASGYHLQKAETVFQNWDAHIDSANINDMIELYNIKKYIDADMQLNQWSDTQFSAYKDKCKDVPRVLGKYFSTISDGNLEDVYNATDRDYTDDFWQLICTYKVYQRISPEVLGHLLNSSWYIVWEVLRHKEIVKAFGRVIAEHLSNNEHTAEHLISHFLEAHARNDNQLHFPDEFAQEMRDKVLAAFVERDDININYLQLLEQAQSSAEFPLSDKLRRKARKKKEILQEKMFSHSSGMTYGAEVTFKSIPDYSIEESYKDGIITCAYSREWIEENRDYPTLLNNFIHLFQYVDRSFRCKFVSLQTELGVMERFLGAKGKREYLHGVVFNSKRILSMLQMAAYNQELKRINIRLEDVFQWFFEEYLKDEFGANGFTYTPPSEGTTAAEKCILLSTAIDGVLKQYRLYCEDGVVDRELLEMSSEHIVFSELRGMLDKKYVYPNSDDLCNEMFALFSDQSMMSFTEKSQSKYQTLPQLLISEKMTREDFAEFQQKKLDWLIQRSSVEISEDGILLPNICRSFVLKDLFYNEVVCPKYYDTSLSKQIDLLEKAGDIRYENTLFTKPEQDYLNYMLNKAEFNNGLDLRNRYAHGTSSLDENQQNENYWELQKIMIMIIIKINEEFCLADEKDLLPKY
ncbi:MAG: hypothetical protein MJ074_08920 [Oscillospiraceae bacterium]|nr:hypothetical protein [Oscillospiraceae bacterium]